MRIHLYLALPLLVGVVIVSVGCGKTDEANTKSKVATQVAARVNSEEITVHQINHVLARNPRITPESAFDAKREILERLIEQQLASQESVANKLDRSPNTLQAIEAARNEILARAYLEKFAASLPRPTNEEVRKYYAEHPELFAKRRIFTLEEIVISSQEGLATELQAQIAKARSMQDIAGWLESHGVKFAGNIGVRSAEQIPLELLPKLQELRDGAIRLFETRDRRLQVVRIVASKLAPVDEATATPRIQQFLFNRRLNDEVAKEKKRLRDKAQIVYVGEFADATAAAEARLKAEEEIRAKALAETKSREKAEAQARAEELSRARKAAEAKARLEAEIKAGEVPSKPVRLPQENIEKGVRGLK